MSDSLKTGDPLLGHLAQWPGYSRIGRVAEAFGTLIKVTGLQPRIGDLCQLRDPHNGQVVAAEVVGLSGDYSLLTPLGPLEGISTAMEVTTTGGSAEVCVGDELLGRVLDALGQPLDGLPPPSSMQRVPLYRSAPNAMQRLPIEHPLETGIRAVDGVLSIGQGQRVGIFAVAGGGKSTLLGMLARGTQADVNVIVLVGERGREVKEFIDDNLGETGLRNSVLVVATAERPALERSRAAYLGTAVAEYFRDRGLRVLLLMDSVTRYARALRDVGLALGEPPTRRGFTPSVFANLPRLFERAGNNDKGSITAFYTVLLEDEQEGDDPVGEEVRSLLDGHIVLSRKLAAAAHFPAIDVAVSASRVMARVVDDAQQSAAITLRRHLAKYRDIELLVQVGEYQPGQDVAADQALAAMPAIKAFLQQPARHFTPWSECREQLLALGEAS